MPPRFLSRVIFVNLLKDLQFRYGRLLAAHVLGFGAILAFRFSEPRTGVALALRASRYSDSKRFTSLIRKHIEHVSIECASFLPPPGPIDQLDQRCLILAEPRMHGSEVFRKGVLLVSFTNTGGQLYSSVDRRKLLEHFHLVLEPSSAGYADPSILCWLDAGEPIIVQATELNDRRFLGDLDANLSAVPYGAGDWIDPELFKPETVPAKPIYDSVCVANYGWWKRTHAFLAAVQEAVKAIPRYRAALVLASLGKSEARKRNLLSLLSDYGIAENVHLLESLRRDDLNHIYARSKALAFPSWKEGSSRVLFEAMCANTPVIVLERNVGVNKDYINSQTGELVRDRDFGKALIRFSRDEHTYSPRRWFIDNLGPVNTTRKLAQDLARLFPREGWTFNDLTVKANAPEAKLMGGHVEYRPLSDWLGASHSLPRRPNPE